MLRITAESKEYSWLAINFNWQSRSRCLWPLISDMLLKKPGSNRWIPVSQSLRFSTSNQKCSYQKLMGVLLASWYP